MIRGIRKIKNPLTFYCISAVALIFILFPVVWLLLTSFKTQIDAIARPPVFLFTPILKNYVKIFTDPTILIGTNLINSAIVAVGSTLLAVSLGSLAAYSIARFTYWGRKNIAFWILSIRMLPPIAIALPIVLVIKTAGLTDTLLGLTLVHAAANLPWATWMLLGFFREVPWELEEAAMIDGCSRIKSLLRIIIPIASAGVVSTTIFCIILSWNEFMYALLLTAIRAMTLPAASYSLVGFGYITWGEIAAAAIIIMAPVTIFALLVQKYIVRAWVPLAIKG